MGLDYFHIMLTLAMMALGTVLLVRNPHKQILRKNPKSGIVSGVLFLIFLTVLNSLTGKRWDADFMASFLCFKEIGTRHLAYLHLGVSISYIIIYLGSLQLLFIHKPNAQKYVKEGIEMNTQTTTQNEETVYINARFESSILQYGMIITMIIIGPLGLLYGLIGLLVTYDFVFTWVVKIVFLIICIAWIGMIIIFFLLKKYWIFKILASDSHIVAIGLLRKIDARWNEIISVDVISTGILFGGQMIEVKTKSGSFYFPLTMKEKNKEYPKLDLLGEKWIDRKGEKKTISPENCSLYIEIKKHLVN